MTSKQMRVAPEFEDCIKRLNQNLKDEYGVEFKSPQLTKIVARQMQGQKKTIIIKIVKRKRGVRIL